MRKGEEEISFQEIEVVETENHFSSTPFLRFFKFFKSR
jgi:hypothetical protein